MRRIWKNGRLAACLLVFVLALGLCAAASAEALEVTSVTVDKEQAPVGETLTWAAAASGGAGDLAYRFSLYRYDALLQQTEFTALPVFSCAPAQPGLYSVRAEATDGTDTATLRGGAARVYAPLTVSSVSSDSVSGVVGERVVWTAFASGGMGARTWKFELFKDGAPLQATEFAWERRFSFIPSEAGVYKVLATVRDDTGEASLESGDVTVAPPPPLALDSVTSDRVSSVVGKRILWKARASGGTCDPDDRTYRFDLYKDGALLLEGVFGESRVYVYSPVEPGVYKVTATVQDTSGATASLDSAEVAVTEYPALAVLRVWASQTETVVGRKIVWHAKAAGGTGPKSYAFELFRDGVSIQVTGFKRRSEFTAVPDEPGAYHVRVTAMDGSGATASLDSAAVTVTPRPALSVASVRADKPAAYVGRRITWKAKAEGGEGARTFQFALYIDGALIRTSEFRRSPVFTITPVVPGGYKVVVTVKDGTGTASLESAPVTVTERPMGSHGRNRR